MNKQNQNAYLERLAGFLEAGKKAGYIDYILIGSPDRLSWRVEAIDSEEKEK
jgi:hypothetical protein